MTTSSNTRSLKQVWSQLKKGRALLAQGTPVALPTETVYGLAARIDQPEAISQIFRLKDRPSFDPLIVHVAALEQVNDLVKSFPPAAQKLARAFWPGPLTLVLPRADTVNPMICAGLNTVALRCPAHPFFRRLIRTVGVPLAAPSANKFGKTSPTKAEHVQLSWTSEEVFVVDGGAAEIGIESTVVQFGERGGHDVLLILRPGMIGREALHSVLPGIEVIHETGIASPGHLSKHYQPEIPLVIVRQEDWTPSAAALLMIAEKLGVAMRGYREISLPSEAVLAARQLYGALLEPQTADTSFLLFVESSAMRNHEGWTAILDRLRRASSLSID